jgi:hypothetical protein
MPTIDIDLSAVEWATILIAVGTLLSAAILGATAVYVYRSARSALAGLEDARRTRHAQLVTDLSRRWDEPDTVESMMAYSAHGPSGISALARRLYGASEKEPPASEDDLRLFNTLNRWPSLIETIGVLNSEGAISSEVVYKMWGPGIVAAWKAWSAPVDTLRALDGYPASTFPYFQKLAGEIENRMAAEKKGREEDRLAASELRRKSEAEASAAQAAAEAEAPRDVEK